jgi:hypothetical protein|tara:strand:+ start:73 stop:267 length:195 start_codon:yes stop_codon:yes gene_type:complete
MSKIKKVFLDTIDETELQTCCSIDNDIFVIIENGMGEHIVILDVSTAIAFSKELRTQINLAKEL